MRDPNGSGNGNRNRMNEVKITTTLNSMKILLWFLYNIRVGSHGEIFPPHKKKCMRNLCTLAKNRKNPGSHLQRNQISHAKI